MHYHLLSQLVELVGAYDRQGHTSEDIHDFIKWVENRHNPEPEPDWVGKTKGRSADSVINTTLVHLYRYAKLQAKSAIVGTPFSTPDDFIYLISLTSFGSMSKTALIRLNVHEKPAGMQIINRLIANGFVAQHAVEEDRRSRMIHITDKGTQTLSNAMQQIKLATSNVTAPLSHQEKMELIRITGKLEDFHEQQLRG